MNVKKTAEVICSAKYVIRPSDLFAVYAKGFFPKLSLLKTKAKVFFG